MAVAWVSTVTQWGAFSSPVSSGSFTPTSTNQIAVFEIVTQAFGSGDTISGTGSYTSLGNMASNGGGGGSAAWNSSCSGAAQTVTTANSQSPFSVDGWAFQYSGATSASFNSANPINPGTGSGAIKGVSVTVPSGAILLALCISDTSTSTTVSSPSGTNRGSGTASVGAGAGWCVTEYAGAGSAIQPSFTDTVNGGGRPYIVLQVLLSAAAASAPFNTTPSPTFSSNRLRDQPANTSQSESLALTYVPTPLMGQVWT